MSTVACLVTLQFLIEEGRLLKSLAPLSFNVLVANGRQ